jgi:phosphoribosylformimino-5-aminoimidazole carboxamide ribotide isomerase
VLLRYYATVGIASTFDILPAIDLRGGRVVRLRTGDFEQETAYEADPTAVAAGFAEDGARWIHVVDLDAARSGQPSHTAAIAAIVEGVGERAQIEVAGGLRNGDAVARALGTGAARAVVGTAAIEDPAVAGRLVEAHGAGRIAVAIDVRGGRAVGHGWIEDAGNVVAEDLVRQLADIGVETFEVTAIDRDGLLGGPDLELYERMVALDVGSIIASGGVTTLADVAAVRNIGCSGVIVGRALYEGRLTLRDALSVAMR